MSNFLGYKWLAERLDIVAVQPFAVESQLGRSRRTHVAEALRQETYPASAQLQPTIAAHLTFAFKHEIVNLEFLFRLFKRVDAAVFEQWIRNEPTGGYARRTGFFYEWNRPEARRAGYACRKLCRCARSRYLSCRDARAECA